MTTLTSRHLDPAATVDLAALVASAPSTAQPAARTTPTAPAAATQPPNPRRCRALYTDDSLAPMPVSRTLALWFGVQVVDAPNGLYIGVALGPRDETLYRTRPIASYGAARRLAEHHVTARIDQLLYRSQVVEIKSPLHC